MHKLSIPTRASLVAMLRNALFLALCAGNAFAFSPSSMPLGRRADATARLTLARETPRAARVSALRMQQQPATETEVYTEETTAEDVNAAPAPVSREPVSWFEKTTAQVSPSRSAGALACSAWSCSDPERRIEKNASAMCADLTIVPVLFAGPRVPGGRRPACPAQGGMATGPFQRLSG